MIPYVEVPPIRIGPYTFHPFGLLVAIGIGVGLWIGFKRERALGIDTKQLKQLSIWMLAVGFFLSHVLDEIFYFPEKIAARPWSLLFVWESLSSFGGFVGAVVGGLLWKFFEWRGGPRLRKTPIA